MTVREVTAEEIPKDKVVTLFEPNHAEKVAKDL